LKDTQQQWFKEAKFGLFIHWGLYSVPAGEYNGKKTDRIAEWIENDLDIPVTEYEKLAGQFNPVQFDAGQIVAKAKSWGMKYIVFTSKHHEGFAMFHSRCSKFNIVDATPSGRDVLKELQLACEKYDMKLGLYYSQAQDWDDPDGFMYRKDNSHKNFQKYLENKCLPQIRELLTGYGKIAVMWFDTPMEMTEVQSRRVFDTVKSLQPDCIVSGRIGNNLGEYMTTGDNFIPAVPYPGDWEVPATLNNTWGYNASDTNWKDAHSIIELLLRINSRGGNYLLNIGPDSRGCIPQDSVRILDTVGNYVTKNADGIYATNAVIGNPYELDYGIMTAKPHKIFLHVMYKSKTRLELLNVANTVKSARILENGQYLQVHTMKACEGNSIIEIELTPEYQTKKYYCVCLDTEEELPVFEPLQL